MYAVRVNGRWHYVCLFVDLFNQEIVGASTGLRKNANLIYQALSTIKDNLKNVEIFHTDCGSEFDNQLMIEAKEAFEVKH